MATRRILCHEQVVTEPAQLAQISNDGALYVAASTADQREYRAALTQLAGVVLFQANSSNAGSIARYTFHQAQPAETWTINHDLGCYPAVVICDSAGSLVEGDVTYVSANQVIASFTGAFAGFAYLG